VKIEFSCVGLSFFVLLFLRCKNGTVHEWGCLRFAPALRRFAPQSSPVPGTIFLHIVSGKAFFLPVSGGEGEWGALYKPLYNTEVRKIFFFLRLNFFAERATL